ncbi:purK: phosphoribosylaminoimidazole carboxylase, ATPase subunit (plasmid) [Rubrobacter radiotolerans]|uniref:N5-carboxyaminoimidazole ribonucleotide synthase n=1 Tax=Rubrobacter radiotolerans TaxID=42256 RepID=A0A023X829_RUBRA|nr:5-(carboxyamino)imidazole ribonucleotide synthase [Rubrobacter radiotolerans]AHY48205.1 purK: phosphoribosylaminoimidazole carboxylase, ATPase subunit [Rubrobacter radiotolerans]MDX5895242.1 5-(carboxyamino)imidazole ribonucleotide synthase [Rubrobacter radiotolerans]SMC01863.1 5-(carboxyamino)imidazole ribonucleotide synthase [Rubrobacter radiotolerans DSM 5868]
MRKNGDPVLPGATVGVLGSGQLGRMLALAARQMGYRVHVFSPDSDSPAGQVADRELSVPYEDLDAAREFAKSVDVVTLEFENVPASTAEEIEQIVPLRPGPDALRTTQHRLREKEFLSRVGFPVTLFRAVSSREELDAALLQTGAPAVLKTAGFGYDGKGQAKIPAPEDADAAWEAVGGPAVLEAWVDLEREVSVVGARGLDGSFVHYGVVENTHRNHILDLSVVPAAVPGKTAEEAIELARGVFEELDLVGTACVEFFLDKGGRLLVNEIAPRPHNSGHWTIEGADASQFEQQLRAVCGLPLGSPRRRAPGVAMANLLGDLWGEGEPAWTRALTFPEAKLHLYGKGTARPARKMGHLTALADAPEEAARIVQAARRALSDRSLP